MSDRNAVAICCDARYQPYASFLAWQIATAHPERDFDIVVASTGPLTPSAVLERLDVRHASVDAAAHLAGLPTDRRRSHAAYLWMTLSEALPYRRLLALDADVFHVGGDLGRLLTADMRGRALAAVRDNKQWRTPGRRVKEYRALGCRAAPYFNSGVVLLDCARFRQEEVLPRAMRLAREAPAALGFLDQGLANCLLQGDWAELSPVWNWQYTWASSWSVSHVDPCLVHFIGPRKPWLDAAGEVPLRFTGAYETFLAAHFPQAERAEGLARPRVPSARSARRALVRHWRAAGPMQRYLSRFPTTLTVCDSSG